MISYNHGKSSRKTPPNTAVTMPINTATIAGSDASSAICVPPAVNSPNPKSIGIYTTWKDPSKKPPPFEVPGWFAIPDRYGNDSTSNLTYTVKGGQQVYDIELQ